MDTANFADRIGAVGLPEARRTVGGGDADQPGLGSMLSRLGTPADLSAAAELIELETKVTSLFCKTTLDAGCYRLFFTPLSDSPISLSTTRYRGTLRVEPSGDGYVISGDLYSYRLLDDVIALGSNHLGAVAAFARDTTAKAEPSIPIYRRKDYYSYLEGTSAGMLSFGECAFTLTFDEWAYDHPASGFNGSFGANPTRTITYRFKAGATDGSYVGDAYEGTTKIGTVSIQHVSAHYRRATLQVDFVDGAEAPPRVIPQLPVFELAAARTAFASGGSDVETTLISDLLLEYLFGQSFRTIFQTAGWDLTVVFADEPVPLPDGLAGVDVTACETWNTAVPAVAGAVWSDGFDNLHELMESVPTYDPTDLDTVWRAHLIAVPAELGCSRGWMFDSGLGGVEREGATTFSHDGYPSTDGCSGTASDYGTAADERQFEHARAFLRSAAHEVGHTFNQIHQSFEAGNDNSIMTVTPCVATVIDGQGGTFPDDINLAFNETVRSHLIHLPDPAVRPGGMDFFGSAINAPQAADVTVVDDLVLDIDAQSTSVRLGEPLPITWTLRNEGERSVPVPATIDAESMSARVSVTDPQGRTRFMRPVTLNPCPRNEVVDLEPGGAIREESVVFYGRDGFAFESPGRHTVHVVVVWEFAGGYLAAEGEVAVWVAYPLTDNDNRIASLMLDPDVGRAVARKTLRNHERVSEAMSSIAGIQKGHPVTKQLKRLGFVS